LRRIAIATFAVAAVGLAVFLLAPGEPKEPRVVVPGQPLPMDETVQMHFIDDETGEDEMWTVSKRETSPEDRQPRPLPEPDPEAGEREPVESARVLQGLGLEAWKRGEIPEAMSLLQQAIEADPDDPHSRTQYGRLTLLAMAYSESLPHLERAAELTPDDPQVWLDLATYYEKKLIHERSWQALRRAEELAGGRSFSREERSGFWLIEGESIFP
jgi:tetratricopeptide (TPR) repeat protein